MPDSVMITADQVLKNALQRLALGPAVKPTNLLAEKEAFLHPRFTCRKKSPVFKYQGSPSKWSDIKPVFSFESDDIPQSVIEIYREKQRELENIQKMLAAVGSAEFAPFAVEIFGVPTAEDARQSCKVLEDLAAVVPAKPNCSAKDFAALLETRLKQLGIAIDIKLVPSMATKVSVDSISRTIHLNQKAWFTPRETRRLLVHEVDVHAVRIHNGACLPWGIFSMGTAGYREAEEGLAVYFERQTGHLYRFQEKLYAGRCLAVYLSLSAGFAEVFEELRPYFDDETAYNIVQRVKRGLADTSRPGALTKEFHYFTGPRRVRSYLADGGSLEMLMGGKIAFKHAPVIAKLVQDKMVDTSRWIFPLEKSDDQKLAPR